MSKLDFLTKIACAFAIVIAFAGCSMKYTVKEPIPSSIDYGRKDIAPVTLTIIDNRTGSDAIFLVKKDGSLTYTVNVILNNMEDPVRYFAQHLEKEFVSRGIPVRCAVKKAADEGLTLVINKYQIVILRATSLSSWKASHILDGDIIVNGQKKKIKAFAYNSKVPIFRMKEVEEPCFSIPTSIIIKDVASKINRAVFNLQVSDAKVDKLITEINAEIGKDADGTFWKVLDLGYTNNPKAMEPLKKYAAEGDDFLKACALSAIGTLGGAGQLEFLKQQYRAGDYEDKTMAAKSIGDIGTTESLRIMQDMKKDKAYKKNGSLRYCIDLYTL